MKTIEAMESRSPRMKRHQPEYADQKALFSWAKARSATLPELKLLAAIPNGGQRNIIVAKRLKDTGAKAGFPDIILPVQRGGYGAMFIEMKSPGRKQTPDQDAWFKALVLNGYAVRVCYGWVEAANSILKYLGIMGDI